MNPDYLQIIPLLTLVAYIFYCTYYYAVPMFCLKVLLFYAHIRYRDITILFRGGKITVTLTKNGEELLIERPVEIDPTSRFFAMTVRSMFRKLLRDIRKGRIAEEAEKQPELSACGSTDMQKRGKTEENTTGCGNG